MRTTDKLDLIDKIGRELQQRYTFDDLIRLLAANGVSKPDDDSRNSKWAYTKRALAGAPTRSS
jgi:hypothetical protein